MLACLTRAGRRTRLIMLPLVTGEQARQSQGDIERMLSIVINRIDTHVARYVASEEPLEMRKCILQRLEGQCGPCRLEQSLNRGEHRIGRAHLDGVGHIKIAAPNASHFSVVRAAAYAVPSPASILGSLGHPLRVVP